MMLSLNVARGLLRLWVVAAVVWVLVSAVILYPARDLDNTGEGAEVTTHREYDQSQPFPKVGDINTVRVVSPKGRIYHFPASYEDKQAAGAALELMIRDNWTVWLTFAGIVLGPPLVVLAFGASLVWAFRGFVR